MTDTPQTTPTKAAIAAAVTQAAQEGGGDG